MGGSNVTKYSCGERLLEPSTRYLKIFENVWRVGAQILLWQVQSAARHRCGSELWRATVIARHDSLPAEHELGNTHLWRVMFVARHSYLPSAGEQFLALAAACFQN